MSPIARAGDHSATVKEADAAAARNSGHGMSNRRSEVGARHSGGGGGIGQRRQSSPARVAQFGGSSGGQGERERTAAAAAGEDDLLVEAVVPVSLINLVVHADQRRAPLRMFHFADALPAQPPPPPPPPAHNTPSPRLTGPSKYARGGGRGGRDSGEVGQVLPTTREGVATSAAMGGSGTGLPGDDRKADGQSKKDTVGDSGYGGGGGGGVAVRRCATCETLPVVCIDDGEGEGGEGTAEGSSGGEGPDGRHGGATERDGYGRRGSVQEADLSANSQVRCG